MIILGKPKNVNDYICVTSKISLILQEMGYNPIYREIQEDKIYYIKSIELENIVKGVS